MSWIQKLLILFCSSMAAGMTPVLATAYANYALEPGVCWPDVYGYSLLLPVGLLSMAMTLATLNLLEKKLDVCGHANVKG